MDAVSAGSAEGLSRGELNEEIVAIERDVRRRLPIGWSTSYQALVKEFVTKGGYSSHALERTLYIMEKREIIRFSGQVRCCVELGGVETDVLFSLVEKSGSSCWSLNWIHYVALSVCTRVIVAMHSCSVFYLVRSHKKQLITVPSRPPASHVHFSKACFASFRVD